MHSMMVVNYVKDSIVIIFIIINSHLELRFDMYIYTHIIKHCHVDFATGDSQMDKKNIYY